LFPYPRLPPHNSHCLSLFNSSYQLRRWHWSQVCVIYTGQQCIQMDSQQIVVVMFSWIGSTYGPRRNWIEPS
jgi:hypothetical protein